MTTSNWWSRAFRVRTSDGTTHAAKTDVMGPDPNDARTACGRVVHHCGLFTCRHARRHQGREFSRETTSREVDCLACLAAPDRQEDE